MSYPLSNNANSARISGAQTYGYNSYLPADAILIDNGDNGTMRPQNSASHNSNGIITGQVIPSGHPQPATSYSLPTATMVGEGSKPQSPLALPQHQYSQYQTPSSHSSNGVYAYATSVAGQPVLVAISPIPDQHSGVDPALSAAHHESPIAKGIRRRNRRNRRAAVGGAAGIVTGAVLLGPFGIVLGYAAGAAAGYSSAVSGERKKDRRLRRERRALADRQRAIAH